MPLGLCPTLAALDLRAGSLETGQAAPPPEFTYYSSSVSELSDSIFSSCRKKKRKGEREGGRRKEKRERKKKEFLEGVRLHLVAPLVQSAVLDQEDGPHSFRIPFRLFGWDQAGGAWSEHELVTYYCLAEDPSTLVV